VLQALKAFAQYAALGFVVSMIACAYIGRWTVGEVKRWLGVP
jgi:hypothetical protein